MKNDKLWITSEHEIITKPAKKPEFNSLENQMIAMGRALMRAKKNMSPEEMKLLVMGLTKIRWNDVGNMLEVTLSKLEVADIMGWDEATTRAHPERFRQLAASLAKHSWIEIDGADKSEWKDGFLVAGSGATRGKLTLNFNDQFRGLLEGLTANRDFVTIWANDIYGFESIYTYLFFEDLRLNCDTTKTNWRVYTTKQLKELFGIPKDGKGSYMHENKKTGKVFFDRANFEMYVLDKVVEEINRGQMIEILPFIGCEALKDNAKNPGKLYEKQKVNGYVSGYLFKYVVKTSQTPPDPDVLPGQYSINMIGEIREE